MSPTPGRSRGYSAMCRPCGSQLGGRRPAIGQRVGDRQRTWRRQRAADRHPERIAPGLRGREAAVRVLLTGAAGFIGSRVGAALGAAGHEVIGVDLLLPAAHGPDSELPPGCRRVDVRDADALAPLLAGVDLVCHQAAMVGAGVNAADAPAYGGHNDLATTVLLAEMFAAGVRQLVLASSMVVYGQGGYACPSTDRSNRCRGGVPIWTAGASSTAARSAARRCNGSSSERTRPTAAQPVRGQQDRAGALRAGVVGVDGRFGGGAALPQRLRSRNAARHPIFRGGGDLPFVDRKRRATKGFRGRRQMRDFVHVDDVAAANVAASPTVTASPRSTSAPGGRSRSSTWPPRCATPATAHCAGRHRAVPQRRRAPHRRRPGAGRRGAGFPRGDRSARWPA